jgi:hypothetical protein
MSELNYTPTPTGELLREIAADLEKIVGNLGPLGATVATEAARNALARIDKELADGGMAPRS